ncbi:MAG: transposase [Cyclobacteriaceae bacterium]
MPYFLTFQVVGWADVFSRKMYRDLLLESLSYCRKQKGMYLFGYVIMTNHMHLIIQQKEGELSNLIRDFKKYTSKAVLGAIKINPEESRKNWLDMIFSYHAKFNKISDRNQFWTHENHAVELSSEKMITTRLNYIHENPVRAGWVEIPENYLYSSARNYSGLKGLIEIDYI